MDKTSPPAIIAITSHVAGSTVGGRVTSALMQARGVDMALVPTVLMGRHPGKGIPGGGPVSSDQVASILRGLKSDGWVDRVDAIFVGYQALPEQVEAVAAFLREVKADQEKVKPDPSRLRIVLDPILGDGPGDPSSDHLYVREDTARSIRDRLVPLADILTPNMFELAWLSGRSLETEYEIVAAARALGKEVIVTSTPAERGRIGTLAVDGLTAESVSTPRLEGAHNGAGDLFAAEALAQLLTGETLAGAASEAAARVGSVFALSDAATGDLDILQQTLTKPVTRPLPRRVGAKGPAWAMGVDGAPSGWCAVLIDMNGVEPPRHALYPDFAAVVAAGAQVIAVDMPIGFQDAPGETGMRVCEKEARAVLGARRSSVFPSPLRPALAAADYREASALNRAAGGKGLSKQSWNLFAKMREIDAIIRPDKESFLFETHPETGFALIAGHPARHAKKTPEGREERLALLEQHGLPRSLFEPHPYRRKDANPDDLVDAGLCALTALRIAAGTASSLPQDPPRDGRGLRMAIFA